MLELFISNSVALFQPKFSATGVPSTSNNCETAVLPGSCRIYKPGLLSTVCSPGYSNIVVLSNLSLLGPDWYENLAASINALCIVTKGLVKEFPLLSKLSVESKSDGFT